MDVMDDVGEVAFVRNFFSTERARKERASSLVDFIIGFGVRVEQMTELEDG